MEIRHETRNEKMSELLEEKKTFICSCLETFSKNLNWAALYGSVDLVIAKEQD